MTGIDQATRDLLLVQKAMHDRLLADKPDGAAHEPADCPLCAMEDGPDGRKGGTLSTYTEDELKVAVDAAVAAKDARIAELETSQQVSETEAKVAAVRAEKDTQIDEIQRQLDAATLEAQTEKERADGIVAWLEAAAEAAEVAAVVQARRDERLAQVKEVANFPDEYLQKHADRFAAMSDEDFEVHLDGLREIASAKGGAPKSGDVLPAVTGLHAGRESESAVVGSATKELFALRRDQGHVALSNLH